MTPAVRESLGDGYDFRAVTPTVREALHEIVVGESQPTEYTQRFGYALEFLCKYLGTPLPNDKFETVTTKGLGIVLEIDGLKQGTRNVEPPIPLANWPSPTLACLTSADAADILARFTFVKPHGSDGDDDRAWVKGVQKQYRSWLRESVRTHQAIVAFLE